MATALINDSKATAAPVDAKPSDTKPGDAEPKNAVCVFTKPFNSLSFDELAQRIAAIGFDGIEAPIRPGGHIEPEQATERLPKLCDALAKQDLAVTILTSNINDVSKGQDVSQDVLRTAADLGIRQFRMQYFRYDKKTPIFQQLDQWKKKIDQLADFCRRTGIQALYQNHAGSQYMGAALWDLKHVLSDVDPAHAAVAYDIRHATVEGGTSWPTTFRMIADHVAAVYVKDFQWIGEKLTNVPLGEGRVKESFFETLKNMNFQGPISLHEEYLDHRAPKLVDQHLQAIETDLNVLKSWMG